MSRLARERLFFQPNSIRYKRLVEQSRRVTSDTTDNLFKMAIHIVKQADAQRLQAEYTKISGSSFSGGDIEGGNIESRIPENEARRLLGEWKKILLKYQ